MINAYAFQNNRIIPVNASEIEKNLADIVWIDLHVPTNEEEEIIEKLLSLDIPTREEMAALELSNRLYKEDDAYYMTVTLITHADIGKPENKPYSFVLTKDRLVTVRYAQIQPFTVFTDRLLKHPLQIGNRPDLIALGLFEAMVNRLADILEDSGRQIDHISQHIFRSTEIEASAGLSSKTDKNGLNLFNAIRNTGIEGDILSKVKESLVSLGRLVTYAKQIDFFRADAGDEHRIKILERDVVSLSEHASFLANKITFLLDATLGMIGMQQNAIIKIFSIAAVIFLPPTLVASIYGMNFKHMPELDWYYGYPMAIVMMFLAAYLPYRFFKFKNWL